jgi:acyl-CoA thioesterase-1
MTPVVDDPNLPRVLLIGDSISIGYTVPVRELLKGKANVRRPLTNCGDTARGLKSLDDWLGSGKWDVIHFNFGLHDLKYLDANGSLASPDKGKQVASLVQYEQNLRQIVERLKKTGAKLIWCSTTPVPEGSSGRVKSDELKYNEVAAKIMAESGVATDDLHALATAKQAEIQLPKNVHFSKEGSRELARAVVASIEKALAK